MIGTWIKTHLPTVWLGAISSIVATVVTSDTMPIITHYLGYSADTPASIIVKLGIYFGVLSCVVAFSVALSRFVPWLFKRLATWCVVFLAFGFRSWADGRAGPVHAKDLWNWISDQVLVAQGRHAFSVECIAFKQADANKPAKVVLLYRNFPGFSKPVYLWPGGRIRGVEVDLGDEAVKILKRETGCSVTLLRNKDRDGQKLTSLDGKGNEIVNWFSAPPFLVMHQNRPQKFGVSGHTALLYVGTLDDAFGKFDEVRMLDVERIKAEEELHKLELWPDTAKSILLAYDFWTAHTEAAKGHSEHLMIPHLGATSSERSAGK